MKERPELENNIIVIKVVLPDAVCCTGCPCLENSEDGSIQFCTLFTGKYGTTEIPTDDSGQPVRLKECIAYFVKHRKANYPPPPEWIVQQIRALKKANYPPPPPEWIVQQIGALKKAIDGARGTKMKQVTIGWWDLTPSARKQLSGILPKEYVSQLNDISKGIQDVVIDWDIISNGLKLQILGRLSSRQINELWDTLTDAVKVKVAGYESRKVLTPERAEEAYSKAARYERRGVLKSQPFIDERRIASYISETGRGSWLMERILRARQLSVAVLEELMPKDSHLIPVMLYAQDAITADQLPRFLASDSPCTRLAAKKKLAKLQKGDKKSE